MRRLLIVGAEVPNFASVPWAGWSAANALDYQGVLLDLRDQRFAPNQASIATTLMSLVNNGHAAYVLLPEAKDASGPRNALTFLPDYHVFLEQAAGLTLKLNLGDPFFINYINALSGHEVFSRFHQLPNVSAWPIFTGIVDNVSRVICAKVASVYVLHPPARKLEQKAFKIIIEHFRPDPPPISTVAKPAWVDEAASAIPGVSQLQTVRAGIRAEIQQKSDQLAAEEEKLRALSSWADLLWLEGLSLQGKVSEALKLLGITTNSDDPSAHSSDLVADESGVHFVFEVTGTTGTIGIEKGRQLMQWVADAPDPANSKGVLIANAFRNDPPAQRPRDPQRFGRRRHREVPGLMITSKLCRFHESRVTSH